MNGVKKSTSLFLLCNCGHVDGVWSVKCSMCKNYRNFKSKKNNDKSTLSNRKKRLEI